MARRRSAAGNRNQMRFLFAINLARWPRTRLVGKRPFQAFFDKASAHSPNRSNPYIQGLDDLLVAQLLVRLQQNSRSPLACGRSICLG
jgi:hypothetical protein